MTFVIDFYKQNVIIKVENSSHCFKILTNFFVLKLNSCSVIIEYSKIEKLSQHE